MRSPLACVLRRLEGGAIEEEEEEEALEPASGAGLNSAASSLVDGELTAPAATTASAEPVLASVLIAADVEAEPEWGEGIECRGDGEGEGEGIGTGAADAADSSLIAGSVRFRAGGKAVGLAALVARIKWSVEVS